MGYKRPLRDGRRFLWLNATMGPPDGCSVLKAPGPGGPGFAAHPFRADMNPAPEVAPSMPNQPPPPPLPPPEPNFVAVAVPLGKQPEASTLTPRDDAGPNIKPQPVPRQKLEDDPDDQLLMVKSNSLSAVPRTRTSTSSEQVC
jgi:hypothetical protein